MATLSLQPVSPCSVWKSSTERGPVPKPFSAFFFNQPVHHSLTPASWSRPGPIKSRGRAPVLMSLQMEETAAMANQAPPEPEITSVVDITIPPESLAGFEADYESVSATWPADLATSTDDAVIEQFVSSAHSLARRWLPQEVISQLESFIYDPNAPPALVIRGLPIDKELPPTGPDCYLKKAGKCVSETWLVGIGRIVGQVFTFNFLRGSRTGMGLLVREIYTTAEKVEQVSVLFFFPFSPCKVCLGGFLTFLLLQFWQISAEGSRELLDMHVDFFQVSPEVFPNVIGFIGVRGDRDKEGKTLLTDNRKLYRMVDSADIQVLRSQRITWGGGGSRGFSAYVIEGSDSNPKFNIFEENLLSMGGFDKVVQGSPEAVAAYKRVKAIAASLMEGVWLGSGDVLLLNQKKASHGRSPYAAKYDGHDRWLQRAYINSGGFWESGMVQWPGRTVTLSV
jgi:L-asparagine oxygenase